MQTLLEIICTLIFIALYPITILYVVLQLNAGIYSWLIITAMLTPPTITWYIIQKKRRDAYINLLLGKKKNRKK